MTSHEPPSRDQQQAAFLSDAQECIEALIPPQYEMLRDTAFDYATMMMISPQLPSSPPTLRGTADSLKSAFLAEFRHRNQLALGTQVLEAINATAAQYGSFKEAPGSSRG